MELPARVAETIRERQLFGSNDSILVAISGGPDSTALLHCLMQLGYSVEAAHLNHQFRGVESDGDAAYVAILCKSLSVKLTTKSIDVPAVQAERHVSAQQAARSVRYDFLEQVRADRQLTTVATAHNYDDRIETVLLNIVRGTGIDGLSGIPYRRGNIIRPLLDTTRQSVEAYCEERNLSPRIDSSNALSKYSRNNVRSELLPYLERRYNQSIRQSLFRLSEIASDESDYVNALAAKWLGGKTSIVVADLIREPAALQRRVLREWIRREADSELADVTHLLIEQFRRRMIGPSAVTLPGGDTVIESDGANIKIRRLTQPFVADIQELPLQSDHPTLFSRYWVEISGLTDQIDSKTLCVRTWRNGDRITLSGGTKKVQDVYTDRKFPRDDRRSYPILEDKAGIIAVGSLVISARAKGITVSVIRAD